LLGFFLALALLSLAQRKPDSVDVAACAMLVMLVILAVPIVAVLTFGRSYPGVRKVREHSEVLPNLLENGQQFALFLRPFGYDGQSVIYYGYRPWWLPRQLGPRVTLEYLLAQVVRDKTGAHTYAVVDQTLAVALNGVLYIRATNESWQYAVGKLMEHAFVIALMVTPRSKGGDGFQWEIRQILRTGRVNRVILILPPFRPWSAPYRSCALHAAEILATLDRGCGTSGVIDPQAILHWQDKITSCWALVIDTGNISTTMSAGGIKNASLWHPKLTRWQPKTVGREFYSHALSVSVSRMHERYNSARSH
jgi:hypothetical protein